ncbi:hypothetical protein Tco_0441583 [Tanacetum coccineum]
MAIMAENVIAAGAENRPPMLEKGMYDSWNTRILHYIEANETKEEETRLQEIKDLSPKEKLRKSYDIKVVSIILLGLPVDIYTLPEWSRFVTAAKQAKDFYVINFDQLYAYLKQNENDANEVLTMQQRFPNPLALMLTLTIHLHLTAVKIHKLRTYQQQIIPSPQQQSYEPPIGQQQSHALSTQLDSGFVVPSFLLIDDRIANLNKAMMFLSRAISLRFPSTNNQLRTSSNPRTQATIQDGRVTVQNVQGPTL